MCIRDRLGILCSLVLNLAHADVTLTGKHEKKLKIAEGQHVSTVKFKDLKIRKVYDVVVEATGAAKGFGMALQLVKPRGTVVLKSTVAEVRKMNLAPVVIDEISVIGSRCGPFKKAVRALSGRLIDVKPLITGIYPFDRAEEALRKAAERDSLKVIMDFRHG